MYLKQYLIPFRSSYNLRYNEDLQFLTYNSLFWSLCT